MNEKVLQIMHEVGVMELGPIEAAVGRQPVYADLRKTFFEPKGFAVLIDELAKMIENLPIDVLCGAETAGIPIATALSLKTGLPFSYVRKKKKDIGMKLAVEGEIKPDQKVALVDDIFISDKNKTNFIEFIEETNAKVTHLILLMDANLHKEEWLKDHPVEIIALATATDLTRYLMKIGYYSQDFGNLMIDFWKNPEIWQTDQSRWEKFEALKKDIKSKI